MKYIDGFDNYKNDKDIVWLSKELKRETAGIDSMGNRHVNYIKSLRMTLNMKQGSEESNESYLKRLNASVESLKLAGGAHVLTSPDLITTVGTNATKQEEQIES
mmetsp:Transcript_11464/g.16625  ORF Transcript_11464/g.16625 Transcript_11464/m.16625 type:complete len:104 (+) Transcript_11464:182-493(+)